MRKNCLVDGEGDVSECDAGVALGIQLVAELYECDRIRLNDTVRITRVIGSALRAHGFTFDDIQVREFSPVGVTATVVLSESHLALHTFPESCHVSLDIYHCRPDPVRPLKVLCQIASAVGARNLWWTQVRRGIDPFVSSPASALMSYSQGGVVTTYTIEALVCSERSPFQEIAVIDNLSFGRMLFLDGDPQLSEYDAATYCHAILPEGDLRGRSVTILGGGDGTVAHEALNRGADAVVVVEIDRRVVEISDQYLSRLTNGVWQDTRLQLVTTDALKWLDASQDLDVLIIDLTEAPIGAGVGHEPLTAVIDRAASALTDSGVLALQAGPSRSTHADVYTLLARKRFAGVCRRDVFIPSYCESWAFLEARKS